MDTNPLPTQDLDESDSGIVDTYVVRLTPHEKFTFQELHDLLKEEYQISSYVLSRELVPQEHFHLVVEVDSVVSEQDVRDIFRAFLIPYWEVDHKLPRGFGNKQYNLQVAEDVTKAISYCVKDKDYVFEGYSAIYIQECAAASFSKKKPSDFKTEYRDLCTKFQDSTMDIREFMIQFSQLKAKYGQQVNIPHAYNYALSNLILREPDRAEDFVENFLYKQ